MMFGTHFSPLFSNILACIWGSGRDFEDNIRREYESLWFNPAFNVATKVRLRVIMICCMVTVKL